MRERTDRRIHRCHVNFPQLSSICCRLNAVSLIVLTGSPAQKKPSYSSCISHPGDFLQAPLPNHSSNSGFIWISFEFYRKEKIEWARTLEPLTNQLQHPTNFCSVQVSIPPQQPTLLGPRCLERCCRLLTSRWGHVGR